MSKKQAAAHVAENQEQQAKAAAKVVYLREKLYMLPRVQQEAAANYFNLYNAAAWLYNEVLSPDAKEYVEESISYARELQTLEQLPNSSDDSQNEQIVNELNHGE